MTEIEMLQNLLRETQAELAKERQRAFDAEEKLRAHETPEPRRKAMHPWLKDVPWYRWPWLPVLLAHSLVEHWRDERKLAAEQRRRRLADPNRELVRPKNAHEFACGVGIDDDEEEVRRWLRAREEG